MVHPPEQDGNENKVQVGRTPGPSPFIDPKQPRPEVVPDLTGHVKSLDRFAAYEGTHSNIFKGTWKGEIVAIKVLRGYRVSTTSQEEWYRAAWEKLDHEDFVPHGFIKGLRKCGDLIPPWCEGVNARQDLTLTSTSRLATLPPIRTNEKNDLHLSLDHLSIYISKKITPRILYDLVNVSDLTGSVTLLNQCAEFGSYYSEIYKGKWRNITVAVKVTRPLGTLRQMKRRLRRESETWWKLKHGNILPLYGFAEDFGSYGALVSPWCSRGSVGLYLRQSSVHPLERFKLWHGVLRGTNYLHSCAPQIIHGDLKPDNVLIDDEGNARLCDFGLVRLLSEESTGFTTTTAHTGTTRYLSYELIATDTYPTSASDVYAVGCLGLEFIFLRSPYSNQRKPALIHRDILQGIPPAVQAPLVSDHSQSISRLWAALMSCWDIDPENRPSILHLLQFVGAYEDSLLEALDDGFSVVPELVM